jgi:hypothetical protein
VELRCRLYQIYVVLVTDSSQNKDYNLMHLTEHSSRVFSKCRATNQWMVAEQTVHLILRYRFIHR